MRRFATPIVTLLVVLVGLVSNATASHPSRPLWTVELQQTAGPQCLPVSKDDNQKGVFEIENLCGQEMTVQSATCSPSVCAFESIAIEDGATERLGPESFGLNASDFEKGETIHVEFDVTVGGNNSTTMAVKFTFEGWSDASHGTADAGGDASSDAGGTSADTGGRDSPDAASSADAGADAQNGGEVTSDGESSDGGGCSAVGGGPVGPVLATMFLLAVCAPRNRGLG